MLKQLFALAVIGLSADAYAVNVIIDNPCGSQPWVALEFADAEAIGESAGALTIAALDAAGLDYVGSDAGLSSVNATPTGDAAMEIISDSEMRAYGWCYHVNDREPALYPNEILIESAADEVRWFFAYARYVDGAWAEMCVPTSATLPAFICGRVPQ